MLRELELESCLWSVMVFGHDLVGRQNNKHVSCLLFYHPSMTLDQDCGSVHLKTVLSYIFQSCPYHFQSCPYFFKTCRIMKLAGLKSCSFAVHFQFDVW